MNNIKWTSQEILRRSGSQPEKPPVTESIEVIVAEAVALCKGSNESTQKLISTGDLSSIQDLKKRQLEKRGRKRKERDQTSTVWTWGYERRLGRRRGAVSGGRMRGVRIQRSWKTRYGDRMRNGERIFRQRPPSLDWTIEYQIMSQHWRSSHFSWSRVESSCYFHV